MNRYLRLINIAVAICAFATGGAAQRDSDRVVVAWSDASRPGIIDLKSNLGAVTVTASSVRDVIIEAKTAPQDATGERRGARGRRGGRGGRRGSETNQSQADGLVRLPQPVGLDVHEQNNVMSI